MKFFWRYIFPVLFGLLIYASVRVMADITIGDKFWIRPWKTNAIEITFIIFFSFAVLWMIGVLIKIFENRKNRGVKGFSVSKEFLIIFVSNLLLLHFIIVPLMVFTDDGMQLEDYVIGMIIPSLYVLLYFAIVRGNLYLKNYVNQKIQLEKISNDQLQTELKFLKAQYHPHFLFNALNTVYFQMDENVAEAKKTVEKFSELLRYQLYDQQQTVPIIQEINYLKNFIDIQKVRTSEKLELQMNFDPALNLQQVYPLLFLPLVENAFKYVGGEYKINIDAKDKGGVIEFSVVNSIPEQEVPEKQNGIGLENLKRRLILLYPEKHEMIIKREGNNFVASLKLNIHQSTIKNEN
jgi:two-component system LytT family sensor kinase